MFVNLFPCYSLGWIDRQTSLDKISGIPRNINPFKIGLIGLDILQEYKIIGAVVGINAIDHLIENNAN